MISAIKSKITRKKETYSSSLCSLAVPEKPKTSLRYKVHYEVQHGFFKWVIENISYFPRRNDKYCMSPAFALKETSWHIALHPRAKAFGVHKIALNLIRSNSDRGPQSVGVSYRLGLENADNKVWFKAEENKIFGKGDSYGFETSILGYLEDFMDEGSGSCDTVSVLCEVYVRYPCLKKEVPSNIASTVDLNLQYDLINLFRNQQYTNILIQIPKFRIRAHKAVLCARSKTLSRMLEDDKSYIQLNCTRSCLYCVLIYMYSGSFHYLARNAVFSIGLYELACELSLTELRNIVIPQNIELRSRIIIDKCKMKCRLSKFQLSDIFNKSQDAGAYFDKVTGIRIKFSFKRTDVSPNYFECCTRISGFKDSLDFSFKLFLLDKTGDPPKLIPAKLLQKSNSEVRNFVFNFPLTFTVGDVMRCFSDGCLFLIFTCVRYTLKHLSDTTRSIRTGMETFVYDLNNWLEHLSIDLEGLHESGKLSDMTLISMGEKFKVHHSIMAARSGYFRKERYSGGQWNKTINISNVSPFTLELMLTYIYSGFFCGNDDPDLDNGDLLELYEAAENYEIESLKEDCEDFLSTNLTPSFVHDVLIVAKKYNNTNLMTLCLNYIKFLGGVQKSPVQPKEVSV